MTTLAPYRTHENGPLVTISVVPGAVTISMLFDAAGRYCRLHSHVFDHWMTVKRGPVMIELDGERSIKQTGECYLVEAGKRHGVHPMCLDAVVECTHEHPDIHPDKAGDGIPLEWLDRLTHREAA